MDKPTKCDFFGKLLEQYFHVVLFVLWYNAVLTLNSVDQAMHCDNFFIKIILKCFCNNCYLLNFAGCIF